MKRSYANTTHSNRWLGRLVTVSVFALFLIGQPLHSLGEQAMAAPEELADQTKSGDGGESKPYSRGAMRIAVEDASDAFEEPQMVLSPLIEDEKIERASLERDTTRGGAIVITYADDIYTMKKPESSGTTIHISTERFSRYISSAFTMLAERVYYDDAISHKHFGLDRPESKLTLTTNLRTVTLMAGKSKDGLCYISKGDGKIYAVKSTNAKWRGASEETLTGRLFLGRKGEDVASLVMKTQNESYTFSRDSSHTLMFDGSKADRSDFARAMEMLFTLPLTSTKKPAADGSALSELSGTIQYFDGGDDKFSVKRDGAKCYIFLNDLRVFTTDQWRISAFLIACQGTVLPPDNQ